MRLIDSFFILFCLLASLSASADPISDLRNWSQDANINNDHKIVVEFHLPLQRAEAYLESTSRLFDLLGAGSEKGLISIYPLPAGVKLRMSLNKEQIPKLLALVPSQVTNLLVVEIPNRASAKGDMERIRTVIISETTSKAEVKFYQPASQTGAPTQSLAPALHYDSGDVSCYLYSAWRSWITDPRGETTVLSVHQAKMLQNKVVFELSPTQPYTRLECHGSDLTEEKITSAIPQLQFY